MEKAAVFIDAGHYHYHLFEKWKINYKKLINYFEYRGFNPKFTFYYEGMITKLSYFSRNSEASFNDFKNAKMAKKNYFKILRSFGFTIRSKPVHRIYDHRAETYKFKCNFDVEITIDIVDTIFTKEIDTFIICSGDGDLTKLAKYLKGKGRKVIIVGFKKNTNQTLIDTAHEIIFLEAIKHRIEFV